MKTKQTKQRQYKLNQRKTKTNQRKEKTQQSKAKQIKQCKEKQEPKTFILELYFHLTYKMKKYELNGHRLIGYGGLKRHFLNK